MKNINVSSDHAGDVAFNVAEQFGNIGTIVT